MTFVIILIGVALDRLLETLSRWRDPAWFDTYFRVLRDRLAGIAMWSATASVLVAAAIPVAAVWLAYAVLDALFAPLGFLAVVVILVMSLGPRELTGEFEAYSEAIRNQREDEVGQIAQGIVGGPVSNDHAERNRAVTQAILMQANDRLFGVLFWFALLGPVGAVLYRVADLLRHVAAREFGADSEFGDAALRLHGLLAWAPARLLALSYALAGSFEDAMTDWKAYYENCATRFFQISNDVLICTGRGALRVGTDEADAPLAEAGAAVNLVYRALIVWLAALGLFTLAGLVI